MTRNAGIFGRLTQVATADLPDMLDELTDGTGDGCVAVERTRLEGVADHVTIHANHAELIRAPLLFPDPGPVACMPDGAALAQGRPAATRSISGYPENAALATSDRVLGIWRGIR